MAVTVRVPKTTTKANPTKVLGTASKVVDKPRTIPFVDVKLGPWEYVKTDYERTTKDIYRALFKEKSFVTYDYGDYFECRWGRLGNTAESKMEQGVEKMKPAKFFVFPDDSGVSNDDNKNATIQLIGDLLMLSPVPLYQATTLKSTTGVDGTGHSGNTLWVEEKEDGQYFNDEGKDISDAERKKKNDAVAGSTYVTNVWDSGPTTVGIGEFEEMGESNEFLPGMRMIHRVCKDTDMLWSSITSGFKLKKNQSFCIGVKLFPANPVRSQKQHDFWSKKEPDASSEGARDKEIGKLYPWNHRDKTAVEIHWGEEGSGALVFILHEDGKFFVYRSTNKDIPRTDEEKKQDEADGKEVKDTGDAPQTRKTWATVGSGNVSADVMGQKVAFFTFIPAGTVLYIYYTAQPTTADTQRGVFSQILFDGNLFYEEAEMRMYSYLGDVNFAFFPIVFPSSGLMFSPVIQTSFPLVIPALANLAYVGKFGGGCQMGSDVTFPHPQDKDKKFEFLSGVKMVWAANTLEPKGSGTNAATMAALYYSIQFCSSQDKYAAQDGRGASSNSRDPTHWYSPMLFNTQITMIPGDVLVNYAPDPQIKNEDVLSVNLSEGVEGNRCTIVLNNRRETNDARKNPFHSTGRYTWTDDNNFIGVKPIRVRVSYDETKLGAGGSDNTRFFGYVTDRKYARASPGNQSTVTLECEDRSKRLKETLAFNLPIYDGWCHLAVIYHLAREAGFQDEEIMLWQDPQEWNNCAKLSSVMTPPGTAGYYVRNSGCWHGHADKFPRAEYKRGGLSLPSSYIHMTLPNTTLSTSPAYMFQTGTSIWDCMQQVRKHSNWYLFCNHWGSLVYSPPQFTIRQSDWEFVEVDKEQKFNEYQRNLNVDYLTAEFRNAVSFLGFVPLRGENPDIPLWTPDPYIKKQKGWPWNINEPGFVPWLRWVIMSDPKWNDPSRNASMVSEIFRRVTRQRIAASFGGWGQDGLFPYDVVKLDESKAGETGINDKRMVISGIQHTLQAGQMWSSAFTTERYDPEYFEYDSRM